MSYSQGGLISAADYNTFVAGGSDINSWWATGTGRYGYGQTAIANVAIGSTVTASQWATLINSLNSGLTHQSGSGSGISAATAGQTVTYVSQLSSNVSTAYTNHNNFASQGSTTTGSTFSPNFTVGTSSSAETWTFTRTITFSNANAMRFFFNAGGYITYTLISVSQSGSDNLQTDWVSLINGVGSCTNIGQVSNSGKQGVTYGTLNTNNTGLGYYNLSTSGNTWVQMTSTTYPYTADYIKLVLRTNGQQNATYADNGSVLYIDFTLYAGATKDSFGNKALNVTWNHRIDIVNPETTNLTNSWGSITIT